MPDDDPPHSDDDGGRTIEAVPTPIILTTDDLLHLHLSGQHLEERYADHGEIGRGGSSSIRRVFDKTLLRETALKVLDPAIGFRPTRALSFLDEARLTGQLEHPSIVPVHELGIGQTGSHYFSMKLIEGETLEKAVTDAGEARLEPDSLRRFMRYFARTCEAIGFAHNRGVIHRDIKPENIMVGAFGQVYVMDWGIARILQSPRLANPDRRVVLPGGAARWRNESRGDIIGTPLYMAPEQANGLNDELDERTDIFALGATLYYILTGCPPYERGSAMRILVQANCGDITPPSQRVANGQVPLELDRIAMKAMAHNPEDRYQSCADLQQDIDAFIRGNWHLPQMKYVAGERIITQGEAGRDAYIIAEGTCTVIQAQDGAAQVLGELGPGDVFGELAIFSNAPRNASVEAKTDVTLLEVSAKILAGAVGMDSWVGPFIRALTDRYRDLDARVKELEKS